MEISVASHAHRKLSKLDRYEAGLPNEFAGQSLFQNLPFAYGELLGRYRNDHCPDIVFTSAGLFRSDEGEGQFLAYSEIFQVSLGPEKELEDDSVFLQLHSGEKLVLKIEGKDAAQGTHDKYAILMFLQAAKSVRQPTAE